MRRLRMDTRVRSNSFGNARKSMRPLARIFCAFPSFQTASRFTRMRAARRRDFLCAHFTLRQGEFLHLIASSPRRPAEGIVEAHEPEHRAEGRAQGGKGAGGGKLTRGGWRGGGKLSRGGRRGGGNSRGAAGRGDKKRRGAQGAPSGEPVGSRKEKRYYFVISVFMKYL